MLESDVGLGAKLLLAHAEQSAAQPQPFAGMKVDGVVIGNPVMPWTGCLSVIAVVRVTVNLQLHRMDAVNASVASL